MLIAVLRPVSLCPGQLIAKHFIFIAVIYDVTTKIYIFQKGIDIATSIYFVLLFWLLLLRSYIYFADILFLLCLIENMLIS